MMESDSQVDARNYEHQAHNLEQQGDHAGAIRMMERALLLRNPQGSLHSAPHSGPVVEKELAERLLATERLVVKYNTVAVRAFKHDDYESAMVYLNNALKLTEPGAGSHFESTPDDRLRLRGTTFNNLGCLERRRGRMELALNYLQLSVEHGGDHSASTYLNMSAILNSLGRPSEAAGAARRAVGLYEASTATNEEERASGVLAIAYHNLAMALETLEPQAAAEAYWAALTIAKKELGPSSTTTQAIERNKNRFSQTMSRRTGYSSSHNQQHQQGGGLLPPITSPAQNRGGSRTARGRTPQNRSGSQSARQTGGSGSGPMASLPHRQIGGQQQYSQSSRQYVRGSSQQGRTPRGDSPVDEPMYARTSSARTSRGNQQPVGAPRPGFNATAPPRRQGEGTPSGVHLPRRSMGASKTHAPLPGSSGQEPPRQPTPPAEGQTRHGRPTMTSRQREEDRYQQQQGAGQPDTYNLRQFSEPVGPSAGRSGRTPSDAGGQSKLKPQPPTGGQLDAPGQSAGRRMSASTANRHAAAGGRTYGSSASNALSNQDIPYSGLPGEDGRKEDLITFLTNRLSSLLRSEEEYEARYVAAVKIQCLARRRQAGKQLASRRRKRSDVAAGSKRSESLAAARVIRFFKLIMVKRKALVRRQQQEQIVKDERRDAAVKIQSSARRWLAKNKVKRLRIYYRDYNKSLRVLQCWFRQLLARFLSGKMKTAKSYAIRTQLLNEQRERSATDIQRLFRAYKSVKGTDSLRGSARAANERERQSGRVYGAKRIQCAWRGYAVRKVSEKMRALRQGKHGRVEFVERRRSAVVMIQRLTRGFLSRRRSTGVRAAFIDRKYAKMQQNKANAAVKIQSQVRRFLAGRTQKAMHAKYYAHKKDLNLAFRGALLLRFAQAAFGELTVRYREHVALSQRVKLQRMLREDAIEQSAQQVADDERRQKEKAAILRHQKQDAEWRQTVYKSVPQPPAVVPVHMRNFDQPGTLNEDPTVMRGEIVEVVPELNEITEEIADEEIVPQTEEQDTASIDEQLEGDDSSDAQAEELEVMDPKTSAAEGSDIPEEIIQDNIDHNNKYEPDSKAEDRPSTVQGEAEQIQEETGQIQEEAEQIQEQAEQIQEQAEQIQREEAGEVDANRVPLPHEEGYQRPVPTEPPVRLQISAAHLERKRKEELRQRIDARIASMQTKPTTLSLTPSAQLLTADPMLVSAEYSCQNKATFKITAFFRGLCDRRRMIETRNILRRYLDELTETDRRSPTPIESQMTFAVLAEIESDQGPKLAAKRQQLILSTLQRFGRTALAQKEMQRLLVVKAGTRNRAASVLCNARRLVLAKKDLRQKRQHVENCRVQRMLEEDVRLVDELTHAATTIASHCRSRLSELHHNNVLDTRCRTIAQKRLVAFHQLIVAKQELKSRQANIQKVLACHSLDEAKGVASIKIQRTMRRVLARSERHRRAEAISAQQKQDDADDAAMLEEEMQKDALAALKRNRRVSMAPSIDAVEEKEYKKLDSPAPDAIGTPTQIHEVSDEEDAATSARRSSRVDFTAPLESPGVGEEVAATKIQALARGRSGRKAATLQAEERRRRYAAKVQEALEEEAGDLLVDETETHSSTPRTPTPAPTAPTPGDIINENESQDSAPRGNVLATEEDSQVSVETSETAIKKDSHVKIQAPSSDDEEAVHPQLMSPAAGTVSTDASFVSPPMAPATADDNDISDRQSQVDFVPLPALKGEPVPTMNGRDDVAAATVQRGFRVHLAKKEVAHRRQKKEIEHMKKITKAAAEDSEKFLKQKPPTPAHSPGPPTPAILGAPPMLANRPTSGSKLPTPSGGRPPMSPRSNASRVGSELYWKQQDAARARLDSANRKRARAQEKTSGRKSAEMEAEQNELDSSVRRQTQLEQSRAALQSEEERRDAVEAARIALMVAEEELNNTRSTIPVLDCESDADRASPTGSVTQQVAQSESIAAKLVEGCPQCEKPIDDDAFEMVGNLTIHIKCLWTFCNDKGLPKCKHCNKHIYSVTNTLQLVPNLTSKNPEGSNDSIHTQCIVPWKASSRPKCGLCFAQVMDATATYISSEGEEMPTAVPADDEGSPASQTIIHVCHVGNCASDLQASILLRKKVATEAAEAKAAQVARAKEKEDQRRRVAAMADRSMLQSREQRRTRLDDARRVFDELDYRKHYDYPQPTKATSLAKRPMSGSSLTPNQESLSFAVVGGCVQCMDKIADEHFEYVPEGIVHDHCIQPYCNDKQLPKCEHCELYIFSPANPATLVNNLRKNTQDVVHQDCANVWQLASRPKCGYCDGLLMDETCVCMVHGDGEPKSYTEGIGMYHTDCAKDVVADWERESKFKADQDEVARVAEVRAQAKEAEAKAAREEDERMAAAAEQLRARQLEEQQAAALAVEEGKAKQKLVEQARVALLSAESAMSQDSQLSLTFKMVGAGCAHCTLKIENENLEYVSEGVIHSDCMVGYCESKGIEKCKHCDLYMLSDVDPSTKVRNFQATSLANQEDEVHADCVAGWKLSSRPNCEYCEEVILEDDCVWLNEDFVESTYAATEEKDTLGAYHVECADDAKEEWNTDKALTLELDTLKKKSSVYNRRPSQREIDPAVEFGGLGATSASQGSGSLTSLSIASPMSLNRSTNRLEPKNCTHCGKPVGLTEECMENEEICLHMECVAEWERAQLVPCDHCTELIRDPEFTEMTIYPGTERAEALVLHNDCVPELRAQKRQGPSSDYVCPMCYEAIEVDDVVAHQRSPPALVHQRCNEAQTMSIRMSGGCAQCKQMLNDERFEHVRDDVVHTDCLPEYCQAKAFHQCNHCKLYIYAEDNVDTEVKNLRAISLWEQHDHIHADCVSAWMLSSRPACGYCEELILDDTATCLKGGKVVPYDAENNNGITMYHDECAEDVKDSAVKDEEFTQKIDDIRRRSSMRRNSQSQLDAPGPGQLLSDSHTEVRSCTHCNKPIGLDEECLENDAVCLHVECVDEWEKTQLIPCEHCKKPIEDDTFVEMTVYPGADNEEDLALHSDCVDSYKAANQQGGSDYNCPMCGRSIEIDMPAIRSGPSGVLVHTVCIESATRIVGSTGSTGTTGTTGSTGSESMSYQLSGKCPKCNKKIHDEHFEHVGEEVVHNHCLNDFCKMIGLPQCSHCQNYIFSDTNAAAPISNLKATKRGEKVDQVHADCASAWQLASRPKCDFCEELILDDTSVYLNKDAPAAPLEGYYKNDGSMGIYHNECAEDAIKGHEESQELKAEVEKARRKSMLPLGTCDQCQKHILRGQDYQELDDESEGDRLMVHSSCLDDWQSAKAQKCGHCGNPILGDYMECEVPDQGTVYLHEGECADTFAENLVPKCKKCFKPITDDDGGVTLDGEPYHEVCGNEIIEAQEDGVSVEEK